MARKKVTNRVISKIVFTGLLVSTLPVSLPVKGQAKSRDELRTEITQEIKHIKKTVKKLKRAKIIIPTIVAGAGIALTAAAAAVVTSLFLIPRLKLHKILERAQHLSELPPKYTLTRYKSTPMVMNLHFLKKYVPKKLYNHLTTSFERVFRAGYTAKSNAEKATFLKDKVIPHLKDQIELLNIFALIGAPLAAIIIASYGLLGTAAISIGTLFGLSAVSVAKAFKSVRTLKELDKKHPGLLTEKERGILNQLDKLSKNIITQAIIKNLRLKDALKNAVNTAIKKHPLLVVAVGGQKKARKLFATYIKRRWKKEILQKIVDEGASLLKLFAIKLQLKITNKKIKKQEKKLPQLKTALNEAVQTYATRANRILEELKGQMIKAAKKGELKFKVAPQPVVPL